jgi:hypothetical protein
LSDANFCGEVHDMIDSVQAGTHHLFVTNIAADEFSVAIQQSRLVSASMDLLNQAVEHANVVSAGK